MPHSESGTGLSTTNLYQESRDGGDRKESASIESDGKESAGEGHASKDPFKDDLMDRAAAAAVASWFPRT